MKSEDVREHWKDWAETYGTNLRATTHSSLQKELEIAALARWMKGQTVLEAGCGNGINCIELAKQFPAMRFYGFDYVPEMIKAAEAAAKTADTQDRVRFLCADLLEMPSWSTMNAIYDIVFTDRCLINFETVEKQKKAISLLTTVVKPGGYLLLLENSIQAYRNQNHCRTLLGLKEREWPKFNFFLNQYEILPYLRNNDMNLIATEDVSSLHDLLLYVLLPATSKGQEFDWQYEHPLVQAAAELQKQLPNQFGMFGQNRLYVCRKGEK